MEITIANESDIVVLANRKAYINIYNLQIIEGEDFLREITILYTCKDTSEKMFEGDGSVWEPIVIIGNDSYSSGKKENFVNINQDITNSSNRHFIHFKVNNEKKRVFKIKLYYKIKPLNTI